MEREIERAKNRYPDAKLVGIADGAESNWKFLEKQTEEQILDFYHASDYTIFYQLKVAPSRLVRQSLSFSKHVENHIGAIWYFIHDYNAQLAKA